MINENEYIRTSSGLLVRKGSQAEGSAKAGDLMTVVLPEIRHDKESGTYQEVLLRLYPQFTKPHGCLAVDKECQALWHYYTTLMLATKEHDNVAGLVDATTGDKIGLTSEDNCAIKCRSLFKAIAWMYGVEPQNMFNYWPVVNQQARLLNMPEIPSNDMRAGIADSKLKIKEQEYE